MTVNTAAENTSDGNSHKTRKRFGLFKRKTKGQGHTSTTDSVTVETKAKEAANVKEAAKPKNTVTTTKTATATKSTTSVTVSPTTTSPSLVPPPSAFPPSSTTEVVTATKIPVTTHPKQRVVPKSVKISDGSWISRSKYFIRLSDWAFDVVDTDGSGQVDEKELYSGLLLIHLKLGSMAGPAACKPVQRDRVHEIFVKRDLDHSGSLDREEFKAVMSVLCGNIFTRVLAQWSLTLMIVPMLAQYMLDGIIWLANFAWEKLSEMDDFETLESMLSARLEDAVEYVSDLLPKNVLSVVIRTGDYLQNSMDMIPDSVWNTVPVTLISCVLSCIAVPYTILTIDDFFQSLADRKKGEVSRIEI